MFKPAILPQQRIPEGGVICSHIDRVHRFARLLQNPKILTLRRGYVVYVGTYHGKELFVAFVGIGAPSAAILIEELIQMGAKKIIRVGTNDSPSEVFDDQIYLIETTEDVHFSARSIEHADPTLNERILEIGNKKGLRLTASRCAHIDFYYHEHNPRIFAEKPTETLERQQGLINREIGLRDMESGCLFFLGRLRRIQTACLLHNIRRHSVEQEYQNSQDLDLELQCGHLAMEAL